MKPKRKKPKYIVVGHCLDDLRWAVGIKRLPPAEFPYETVKDVALFSSRAEANRYARRLNAGKPGVP